MTDAKTVVVGLDGAGFDLLDPWLEAGKLPTIERIVESGVRGELESVLPPVTSPNWKAYATGKNPGKIGIFWWENVDVANRRVYYPSERKHHNTEYWELLARDQSVGVLGVPTTYPPKAVGEFLVSGAPDAENDGYTHPPELEAELEDELGYTVLKRNRLRHDREAAAREILDLIESRFEAAKYLDDRYELDFLHVATFYLNSLHHFLWDHEYTLEAWQLVDDHLADFLADGRNVVLTSDHGSNAIESAFYVNTWLAENGYLDLKMDSPGLFYKLGIQKDRLVRITNKLGVKRTAKRLTPRALLDRIPAEHGVFKREQKTDRIDWDASRAVASGQGPIYLTVDRDDPAYKSIRRELRSALADVTDPSGRSIARDVLPGEKVYDGPYAEEAPDLVIDQADGVHIPGGIGHDSVFAEPDEEGWRAENKRYGLFAATGPDVGTGTVEDLSILDLAPTLLHLHGCAIPSDVDGRVRTDVFAPDSSARTRDVEYRTVSGRAAELERVRRIARGLDL